MVFTLGLPYVHAHLLLYVAGDTHQSRNDNHADLSMTYALLPYLVNSTRANTQVVSQCSIQYSGVLTH